MSEEAKMDRFSFWELVSMLLGGLLFAGVVTGILFLAVLFQ